MHFVFKIHKYFNWLNLKLASKNSFSSPNPLRNTKAGGDPGDAANQTCIPSWKRRETMRTIITTAALVGIALGSLSPALAASEKKCEAGMEYDKVTQKCVEKKS